MLTSAEIRQYFLDFFISKGHHIVPSAPLVIKNDPTLLFTNAGMNQFKDYFLGNKKAPYPRIADTQKCLRVSGKHNDLEEVGVDTYHHTMFEMLGNWSFGNYFKKEAIEWSWELLTNIYKIDKEVLYVTIFEGDTKENLPKDDEALNEWKKVISEDRIILGNKKDNFWEMGDTGPCGPCTEIHVDCRTDEERKQVDGKTLINKDHPQVIEIWNNVFIQFNRLKDGSLEALPAKHVDTGMGFERLVRVLQDKQSNYATDVFTGTIEATENICGLKYEATDSKKDVAFRVISDHIRAIAFTIADGQLPSNTGAGYVIRRILRRAVRYYYSYLNYKEPLLFQLVPVLSKQFDSVFPELQQQAEFVSRVVKEEEDSFLRTLDKGINRFEDEIETLNVLKWEKGEYKKSGYESSSTINGKIIPGALAFTLYDTYGFPIDLTNLMAREKGFEVDMAGFGKFLEEQKQRSRVSTAVDAEDWIVLDDYSLTNFIGYDSMEIQTRVVKYRKVKTKGKETYQLVLETTPFYPESGGQAGDTGILDFKDEQIDVIDTKKENNLILQYTKKMPAKIDSPALAKIDIEKRRATEIHHSATHLLHAALRKVLGAHVIQKGSLVNAEHLRFDFSHFAKVTDEEIAQVESMVNQKIRENIAVVIKEMKKDEAVAMGAMALFGEKYGDDVRVVIIDPAYSIELCGGTHVAYTGNLGFFKIKHETAIAAGVRRIEAVSGKAAEKFINNQLKKIHDVETILKNSKDIIKSIEQLLNENFDLKKRAENLETKQMSGLALSLLQKTKTIGQINFIGEVVSVDSEDTLKKLGFKLKSDLSYYVIVLATNIKGKAYIIIMIDDELVNGRDLDASQIIKQYIAPIIKGGGGGQKTMATAGGQDASNLQMVIEKVQSLL